MSARVEPSYVLRALGLDDDSAHGSLRFSFGRFTTATQIDYAAERIRDAVAELRSLSSAWHGACDSDRRAPDRPEGGVRVARPAAALCRPVSPLSARRCTRSSRGTTRIPGSSPTRRGGKDSTLLLQLAWEIAAAVPAGEPRRPIYIVSNDTLVESPLVIRRYGRGSEGCHGARSTRCPRTDTRCSASTACHPSRVPMVLVRSSSPSLSSRTVRRAKRCRAG